MTYQIHYNVAYEGYVIEYFNTLKEVMDWVATEGDYVKRWHNDFSIYKVEEVSYTEIEGLLK